MHWGNYTSEALGQLHERGTGAFHCLHFIGATARERHWGNCTREALGHTFVYSALEHLHKRDAATLHCLQCTGATCKRALHCLHCTGATARDRHWGTPLFTVYSALGQLHETGTGALLGLSFVYNAPGELDERGTGKTARERHWGTPLHERGTGATATEALWHSIVYTALGHSIARERHGALYCLQCTGATAGERHWGTPLFRQLHEIGTGALLWLHRTGALWKAKTNTEVQWKSRFWRCLCV